jgi:hypothetical protein
MSGEVNRVHASAVLNVVAEAREDLNRWRASLPDPIKNPTWYALVTTYCDSLEAWTADVEHGKTPTDVRWEEVSPLIFEDAEKPDEPFANLLVRAGHTWTETKRLLEAAKPGKPGRPRKPYAVAAHEMHIAGIPYSKIAAKLCDCGKSEAHDKFCSENTRKVVQEISKLLKRIEAAPPRK